MDIADWRRRIDELDRRIVELISERAHAAQEIGKLKRSTSLPVYEPSRERVIFENVRAINPGPLPDIELIHIYERIVDVMRSLQKNELASGGVQQADSGPRKPGRGIASKAEETGK
jgi:chorismate mutase